MPTDKPTKEEDHGLAISYQTPTNKDDNMMTPTEKKNKIKEDKKKQNFAKFCKFIFYIIILFSIYILIKRLLILSGLVEKSEKDFTDSTSTTPSENSSTPQGIEMKTTNIKNE